MPVMQQPKQIKISLVPWRKPQGSIVIALSRGNAEWCYSFKQQKKSNWTFLGDCQDADKNIHTKPMFVLTCHNVKKQAMQYFFLIEQV